MLGKNFYYSIEVILIQGEYLLEMETAEFVNTVRDSRRNVIFCQRIK